MIHKAAHSAIPVRQNLKTHKLVPWWNQDCNNAVRNRNKAYRILRKCPMVCYAIEYKRLRAEARRAIKNAKINSWQSFCETLWPETPVRHLWTAVHKMSGVYKTSSIPVLQKGEVEAVTNQEKADMFVGNFQAVHSAKEQGTVKGCIRSELLLKNKRKLEENLENDNPINLFFSMKELREAIDSGANTTPGRDGLSYELFKHLDCWVLEEILSLFNCVWAEGYLPAEWKHAVIVPILKPGKDASDPGSYRPIALTLVLVNHGANGHEQVTVFSRKGSFLNIRMVLETEDQQWNQWQF